MKREVGGGVFHRGVHTPDRSSNYRNNTSNNSRLKKSPIRNSNTRIRRNLSEDKIVQKNKNIKSQGVISNNSYNRHHYNKTPSPIRKKNNNLSTSNISNEHSHLNSNGSFTRYASNSQCIYDNKKLQSSNISSHNSKVNSSSNYKFYKALNGIETEINSIYAKNVIQSGTHKRTPVNKNVNMRTSTHYEYNNPYSNSYCSSSSSGINNNRGYQNSQNYNSYIAPSKNYIPYNRNSPLLDKTNSFLEENERLYYRNVSANKETKSSSHSPNNYGYNNYSNSTISRTKETHSTNTVEDAKSSKKLESIEEVHIAFVNMIQSSKKLMQAQEDKRDELYSLKMGNIKGSVIQVEEREL